VTRLTPTKMLQENFFPFGFDISVCLSESDDLRSADICMESVTVDID